jgi:hypothetical protein
MPLIELAVVLALSLILAPLGVGHLRFALRAAILMAARPWSGEPHCDRAGNTDPLKVEDCRPTKIVKLGPARSSP